MIPATTTFPLTDHLGSPTSITNQTGKVVEKNEYDAFGNIIYSTSTVKNTKKFTGKELDSENNLQYYGARYLDNGTGRFNSIDQAVLAVYDFGKLKSLTGKSIADVLSDPQSLNSYAYSRNNPITLYDPDGQWWKEVITGHQSIADFQVELGQAAQQLYNNNSLWRASMEYPYTTAAILGVGSGLVAYGASTAITWGLGELGLSTTIGFNVSNTFNKIKDSTQTAYQTAQQGGPNAGMINRYQNVPIEQINKGINSLEQRVIEHLQYIKNPEKYYPDYTTFKTLSDLAQKQTYNYWYREAENYMSQANVLRGIIQDQINKN